MELQEVLDSLGKQLTALLQGRDEKVAALEEQVKELSGKAEEAAVLSFKLDAVREAVGASGAVVCVPDDQVQVMLDKGYAPLKQEERKVWMSK